VRKKRSTWRFILLLAWLQVLSLIFTVSAQQLSSGSVLELPSDITKKLLSADGSYVLYGVPYQSGINSGPQLWIEETSNGDRKMLHSVGSTLSAAWSHDGTAFYVDDHLASDSTRSYLYEMPSLRRLDVANQITDNEASRLAKGHVYFEVEHWEGNDSVQVHLHGHTDENRVNCFDFRYVVTRLGEVKKISQHLVAATSRGCEE
jgi:hypothetical protein